MRIIVLDYSVGDVIIYFLDKDSEEYFNNLDEAWTFFDELGYNYDEISWMAIDGNLGTVREQHVSMYNNRPFVQ